MSSPSLTHWARLEPRPRSNRFGASLALPIHDPLWFLARQWQFAEWDGTDAGSPAYVEYAGTTSKIAGVVKGPIARPLVPGAPLEPQTLAEPLDVDLGLRVELGQDFQTELEARFSASRAAQLRTAFLALADYGIHAPPADDEFNPLDAATRRFVGVCLGRALDGVVLYQLSLEIAAGTKTLPPLALTPPASAAEIGLIKAALSALVVHVDRVFGAIGDADPEAWVRQRLEYDLQVGARVPDPDALSSVVLHATPNADGEYEWSSFDVASGGVLHNAESLTPVTFSMIPSNVRFRGMPNPRLWMFESNEVSFVELQPDKRDLLKLLAADFMLLHGNDWYILPFPVQLGSLVRTQTLVVHDVFGAKTQVQRADKPPPLPAPPLPELQRFSLFSLSDLTQNPPAFADYFLLPPSAGPLMELGAVLEDVRFARDEMANMAFAIERTTLSPMGEPRPGRERDAAIAAFQNLPPDPKVGTAPLRYQIESSLPAHWIPLLGVQPDPPNPSIMLEKGVTLRRSNDPLPHLEAVPSLSKILRPNGSAEYRIYEEEIPRSGTVVQRVLYRTRWYDGSSHLWLERRRRVGAGESQSNVRFDQAVPNDE